MKVRRILELTVFYPVGALALLAGVSFSLPGHRSPSHLARETVAVATLKNVASAESKFLEAERRYATFPELVEAKLLTRAFARADGNGVVDRSGYRFALRLPDEGRGRFQAFAWPIARSAGSRRTFFTDETGRLLETRAEVDPNGPAPVPGDPDWKQVD